MFQYPANLLCCNLVNIGGQSLIKKTNKNTSTLKAGEVSDFQCQGEDGPPLDIQETRMRIGLDDEFIFGLLRDFNTKYETFEDTLREFIADNKLYDARMYIHSMAGLAGTIAADELQDRARALELELEKNKPQPDIEPTVQSHRLLQEHITLLCQEYFGGPK